MLVDLESKSPNSNLSMKSKVELKESRLTIKIGCGSNVALQGQPILKILIFNITFYYKIL